MVGSLGSLFQSCPGGGHRPGGRTSGQAACGGPMRGPHPLWPLNTVLFRPRTDPSSCAGCGGSEPRKGRGVTQAQGRFRPSLPCRHQSPGAWPAVLSRLPRPCT